MLTCENCIHSSVCTPYNTPNDEYPNIGDCPHFKDKADYVEVKYGEWIHCETDENDMEIFKCSVCNTKRYGTQCYCGNCGANMKGGAE